MLSLYLDTLQRTCRTLIVFDDDKCKYQNCSFDSPPPVGLSLYFPQSWALSFVYVIDYSILMVSNANLVDPTCPQLFVSDLFHFGLIFHVKKFSFHYTPDSTFYQSIWAYTFLTTKQKKKQNKKQRLQNIPQLAQSCWRRFRRSFCSPS